MAQNLSMFQHTHRWQSNFRMPINLWHQIVRPWFFGVMVKVILKCGLSFDVAFLEFGREVCARVAAWSCYLIYPIKLFLNGCLIDSCVSTSCCFLLWQPSFCVVEMVIKRGLCELRALELWLKCNTYMYVYLYWCDPITKCTIHRTIGASTTPKRWCHSG